MSARDPDAGSMRRYARGIHAEEQRSLKDPAFHAAVAQSHREVAERRAKNPHLYTGGGAKFNTPDHDGHADIQGNLKATKP
jgi:hypothetical protein